MKASDIRDVESEAGVIATLLRHPDYVFYSEQLQPNHFADEQNAYLYYAIRELVKRNIEKIDAYNLTHILNGREATKHITSALTVPVITEIIDLSGLVARNSTEEYKLLVDAVVDRAFRRETLRKLQECETLCTDDEVDNIQQRVYREIEEIICKYQKTDNLRPMGEQIDALWEKIRSQQNDENFIDFKFPALNKYCKISRTDAIVFAAREKRGKSMMLLNCLRDLCDKGKSVLYIDTELSTELFTMRLISHLTGIEFYKIRDGVYEETDEARIEWAVQWIKERNFSHVYSPVIDEDKLISLTKKYQHTYGLDVLILDYMKGNGEYALDAYKNSASLGKMTDTLKNYIAGELGLFVLTAVQATSNGQIADSQKIIRNCSALLYLERKTPEQIMNDGGYEYGNMTLNVRANRNGEIMREDEYISLNFDGNRCMFTEAHQPIREEPY